MSNWVPKRVSEGTYRVTHLKAPCQNLVLTFVHKNLLFIVNIFQHAFHSFLRLGVSVHLQVKFGEPELVRR